MTPDPNYPPISEYAFLSDCHTAALVAADGAVEWMCAPRFDAPAFFGRILDRERGGAWEMEVAGARPQGRRYRDESLVLQTRWVGEGTAVTAHDFLATAPSESGEDIVPLRVLVRMLHCEEGTARIRTRVAARPDYGTREAAWAGHEEGLAERSGPVLSAAPAEIFSAGRPEGEFTLNAGESAAFALHYTGGRTRRVGTAEAERLLEGTLASWRAWSARSTYDGFGADHVRRSAVVLRGLLFDESGGLLAAPTTSLPEWPGGPRNWDYRYVWHRDAALVVLTLLRLGHQEEAGRYLRFLLSHCAHQPDRVAPMMAIDGGAISAETTLDHLEGYARSRPVRRGNEAFEQHQIDTYGHVLDAALSYHEVTDGLGKTDLAELWHIVELARKHWREADDGIWETRHDPRHWTHSKLYAWVCFDRAVRLAELTGDGRAPVEEWSRERDLVREDLLRRGYDTEAGAFLQSYGADNADGSLLRVPLVGFLDGDDPRVLGTIERIRSELGEGEALVHRYDPVATGDGLETPEGAFLLSSFEMVSALVLAGRTEEGRRRFEWLTARAGSLGLFSEEMTGSGRMLGNYPQAFTHLGVIEAAMNIEEAGRRDALHAWAERRSVQGDAAEAAGEG